MNRHTLLFGELLSNLPGSNFVAIVANSQAMNIVLSCGLVLDESDCTANRQITITILNTNRDTRITAQIVIFHTSGFGIHDDGIAFEQIPHSSLLYRTIRVECGQDSKALL